MHTTRCFTWSEIVHVHHSKKLLMEKVVSAFGGKMTPIILLQLKQISI